jgi:(3S)-malyl-CoA thioesterase
MSHPARPLRSVLYLPGSNPRAMAKARTLPCDGLIFDLEDAVAPAEKPAARTLLGETLAEGGFAPRLRLVRINALATPWGAADAAMAAAAGCDGVLVPKVDGPEDLDRVAALVPERPLWAMVETAQGALNAAAIAAHPRLAGLVLGTNDLARELGCRDRADRLPLLPALGMALLAARAAGKPALDGVFNGLRDETGLAAECAQGRDLGFDGKTLIHPAQIAAANAAFAPDAAEITLAERRIAAFNAAQASGQGVAVLDGKIVENLHIVTAQATLAKARAIAAMAAAE